MFFCSNTLIVSRLGNLISPEFCKIRALAPSHTTTHSPCLIKSAAMDYSSMYSRIKAMRALEIALDQTLQGRFVPNQSLFSSCHPADVGQSLAPGFRPRLQKC